MNFAAAFGFGGLVYGLSQLGAESTAVVPPYAMVLFGLAAIAVFVRRQIVLQRSDKPLLDLRTLKQRTFTATSSIPSFAAYSKIR